MSELIEQLVIDGYEQIKHKINIIKDSQVFEYAILKGKTIWLSNTEIKNKYFYANYVLLKNLLIPKLISLKKMGDTSDAIVEEHISMIRQFFTAWYQINDLQYDNSMFIANILSPGLYFQLSDMLSYNGKTFNVYPMYNIVTSAMALRHGIEAVLLESVRYPLEDKTEQTPSLGQIMAALKNIPVVLNINANLLPFIGELDNKIILNNCYDFLSKPLHRNYIFIFPWQLEFIRLIFSNLPSDGFRVMMVDHNLLTNEFYAAIHKRKTFTPRLKSTIINQ